MRIGMILPGDFPPDIRVEKEVVTLSAQHTIALLCLRRGEQPEREEWHGIEIHRVFSLAKRWWSQWSLMSRRSSRTWELAIEDFIASFSPDVLHVHDLPLLGPALNVAARKHIPVVADLHENYPAMLEETLKVPLRRIVSLGSLASRLSVSVPRWQTYEATVVPQACRIIVVIEEARDRLVCMGVPAEIVKVVGNYATLDEVGGRPRKTTNLPKTGMKLRMVYAGGFGPTRDLVTVLEALATLPEQLRSRLEVKLVGGQGRDLEQLQQYAVDLGISEHVTLLQWLPRTEAEQLMAEADVGLVPHVKSAHTDATVPHKLFQYMWRNLPVIVSNCAPLERIVQETGCGLVYESGDSRSLAECLASMQENPDLLAAMGKTGHDAVAAKYNWDKAGEELLQLYQDIA